MAGCVHLRSYLQNEGLGFMIEDLETPDRSDDQDEDEEDEDDEEDEEEDYKYFKVQYYNDRGRADFASRKGDSSTDVEDREDLTESVVRR